MGSVIWVALGGAVGAVGRYGISLLPWKGAFPLLTLATNFLGAVAIGFLSGLFSQRLLGERGKLFWRPASAAALPPSPPFPWRPSPCSKTAGICWAGPMSSSAWPSAWQGCGWASAWPGRWPIRTSIEKQPGPARNQLWLLLVGFMGEAPTPTG